MNQTNNRIREEWTKFVESQVWQGEDEFTKNMGVGNVADWWLEKIAELLKSQRDNLVEKIEKYKVEVKSDFDFEHNITCDDILSLIKEE